MTEREPVVEFEALLAQLQEQVAKLESDSLPLAEAISAYERSVQLANQCHSLLEQAQLRIQRIDASSRAVQESSTVYQPFQINAAALLLGDDDEDLLDLMDDE
jgi:exodeoxyribonuclease VII small subunit